MLFMSCVCYASRMFVAAFWSSAGKGLTYWLSFAMFIVFCHFPMWYYVLGVVLDYIDS